MFNFVLLLLLGAVFLFGYLITKWLANSVKETYKENYKKAEKKKKYRKWKAEQEKKAQNTSLSACLRRLLTRK
ncbi:MAG: hypothetical protein K5707_08170 [Clostridia bacterium]|nr:hypothetical protein [Clostridia bacterium]